MVGSVALDTDCFFQGVFGILLVAAAGAYILAHCCGESCSQCLVFCRS